jgi:hypothetical protein
MHASVFLLGASAHEVDRFRETLGRQSFRGYLARAQRVIWGLSQPDLVRVDVRGTLAALARRDSQDPLTDLLAAYALRGQDPDRAQAALERAQERMPPDHPWRYLLPTTADWEDRDAPQELHEVVPGRVWRVQARIALPGAPFHVGSTATLVRTEHDTLVFINPVALSAPVLAAVRGLGRVAILAVQGRAHSQFVASSRAQFPEARVLLSPGHRVHPPSAHLPFDGLLGTDSARLPEEFLELPVVGTEADEVVLLHRPTRLLICQDLVSNNRATHVGRSFAGKLEYFAFGLDDRIGLLSYHPILWRDLSAFQESLAAIRGSEYALVTAAHFPVEPCAGVDREAFDAALDHVLALSRLRHLAYLAEFFAHQPSFLRDLLRYKNDARRPGMPRGTETGDFGR